MRWPELIITWRFSYLYYLPCPGTRVGDKPGDTDVAEGDGVVAAPCRAVVNNAGHAEDVDQRLYCDGGVQLEDQRGRLELEHTQTQGKMQMGSLLISTLRCPVSAYITFTPRMLPM